MFRLLSTGGLIYTFLREQLLKSEPGGGTAQTADMIAETQLASPADGDTVARFSGKGNNDATAKESIRYGAIEVVAVDVSDGTEDGAVAIKAMRAGVEREVARFYGDETVVLFDDFLAAGIDGRWSSTAGSGTANAAATTVSSGLNGLVTVKSASDDGAIGANGSTLTLDQLNFLASQGGLTFEGRMKISDVSEALLFFGFSDTISSTVEAPIFLVAADIDSDATDACGIGYDVDGTTKQWFHGGVKNGTDTVPAYSGTAPADDTFFHLRVEVSAAGAVQGFVDGVAIGPAVANAVTTSVALTPHILIANRSANQVTLTIDWLKVTARRG